jgi:RNA polymerase sigma-70 factor (ECF subfamily)
MSPGRRRRTPPLTLVTSSAASGALPGRGGDAAVARDWSQLMARAQDGDRDAYRVLLEDITPYLRALASRCFREAADIEDAVQDVLLTIHAVRHAMTPGGRSGHGWSPSPTAASSTGCGARCAPALEKSN